MDERRGREGRHREQRRPLREAAARRVAPRRARRVRRKILLREYFRDRDTISDEARRSTARISPKIPAATASLHFVYGYNLGAFALGSRANIKNYTATVWGAGAVARSQSAIDKKGGEISACTAESAKELDGCKVPIRLTLRAIADGASPSAVAAQAPDTPAAMNLAGQLQARTDVERQAQEHMSAAFTKMTAGDGRGCLTELDAHDHLDPRPEGLSTNPKNARTRALCVMLSGQCDAGKAVDRKSLDGSNLQPNDIDDRIDSDVGSFCRDGGTTDRDRLARALHVLGNANEKHTADECRRALDVADRIADHVQARDTRDMAYDAHHSMMMNGPACLRARAIACRRGRRRRPSSRRMIACMDERRTRAERAL